MQLKNNNKATKQMNKINKISAYIWLSWRFCGKGLSYQIKAS